MDVGSETEVREARWEATPAVSEIIDRSESESDVGTSRHGKTWSLSW